jgi:transcription initiation factor TFIIIB Brf1 subunit/transcription initiation factor TFIIB
MRWRSVSLTACSAALAVAGCGGGGEERLPEKTALRLSSLAKQVVRGRNCGGPLLAATIAAVNRGEVPQALQETLVSDANRIAAACSRRAARELAERLRP